jgi:hypothetical protein
LRLVLVLWASTLKQSLALANVQVDEPALREGLPLKRERWDSYLDWAVRSFRLATVVARPETQVSRTLPLPPLTPTTAKCALRMHPNTPVAHFI